MLQYCRRHRPLPSHREWRCSSAEASYASYLSRLQYFSIWCMPYISCLTTALASPAWLMVALSSFSSVRGCVVTRR